MLWKSRPNDSRSKAGCGVDAPKVYPAAVNQPMIPQWTGREIFHRIRIFQTKGVAMSNGTGFDGREDLVFFGKINASISHELKNVMAIISEAAGFLEDLTKIAQKGEPVQLEMLQTCSREIMEEIQRGFDTIQQMNRFAHSVDDEVKRINLTEVITLMINIAGFLSIAAKVRFDPPLDADPTIVTRPFRLQNLIYQAIVYAFESVGTAGEVRVGITDGENGSVCIYFSGLGEKSLGQFPSDETLKVAASIAAEIRLSQNSRNMDIAVPRQIV
jgi:signal transduction histidine kinase